MWTIEDWHGNRRFPAETWTNADNAEEYLAEFLGDDYESSREEYYIMPSIG